MKHLEKKKDKIYRNKISQLLYEEVYDNDENIENWEEVDKTQFNQYDKKFVTFLN